MLQERGSRILGIIKTIREQNHLCSRQASATAVLIWVGGAGEEGQAQRQAGQQGTRGHNKRRGSWWPALGIKGGWQTLRVLGKQRVD